MNKRKHLGTENLPLQPQHRPLSSCATVPPHSTVLSIVVSPILPSFSSQLSSLEEAEGHPLVEEGEQLLLAGVEARSRPQAEVEETAQVAEEVEE